MEKHWLQEDVARRDTQKLNAHTTDILLALRIV